MSKPMSLTFDDDGNIVVTAPSPGAEVLVAKFTPTGELIWQRAVSMVAAADEERDSVSPVLIDGPTSLRASRLASRRRGRLVVGSVVAACAFTIGIAGIGALAQPGSPSAAARSLRAPVTELAERAAQETEALPSDALTSDALPSEALPSDAATTKVLPGSEAPLDTASPELAAASNVAGEAGSSSTPAKATGAGAEATATAPAPSPPANEVGAEAPRDARAESLALLQDGDLAAAADRGRALVAASPDDAFSYLVLGAALQDQGRTGEARAVYYACAQTAWNGAVAECMALAGLDVAADTLTSP